MGSLRPRFEFTVFLSLIRAIFPNWNFFDRIAFNFELEFKVPDSKKWEPVLFVVPRQSWGILFNSDSNLNLAQINVIEHFARDIQELQILNPLVHSRDVNALSTFKMLKAILRHRLQDYEIQNEMIQFKITARGQTESRDIYISDWISMEKSL